MLRGIFVLVCLAVLVCGSQNHTRLWLVLARLDSYCKLRPQVRQIVRQKDVLTPRPSWADRLKPFLVLGTQSYIFVPEQLFLRLLLGVLRYFVFF